MPFPLPPGIVPQPQEPSEPQPPPQSPPPSTNSGKPCECDGAGKCQCKPEDQCLCDGKDTFAIEPAERDARGTELVLHMKSDHKDLLDGWRLRELVRTYSDYVSWPIKLVLRDKDGDAKLEQINKANALWQRPKSEITKEQYDELYTHLTHDYEPPLAHTHFHVEGTFDFVGLLYVPKRAPHDMNDGTTCFECKSAWCDACSNRNLGFACDTCNLTWCKECALYNRAPVCSGCDEAKCPKCSQDTNRTCEACSNLWCEECLAAGCNDYMTKPIDVDKLISLCRVWIAR